MVNYRTIIRNIDVSEFALPLRLDLGSDALFIEMRVLDRTEKTTVDLRFHYPLWRTSNEEKAIKYVYDCIENAVIHELREQFYYSKKRVYDPHEDHDAPPVV